MLGIREPADQRVEQLPYTAVREVALQVACARAEHGHSRVCRVDGRRTEQSRFPEPRRCLDQDGPPVARLRLVEHSAELRELALAFEKRGFGLDRHRTSGFPRPGSAYPRRGGEGRPLAVIRQRLVVDYDHPIVEDGRVDQSQPGHVVAVEDGPATRGAEHDRVHLQLQPIEQAERHQRTHELDAPADGDVPARSPLERGHLLDQVAAGDACVLPRDVVVPQRARDDDLFHVVHEGGELAVVLACRRPVAGERLICHPSEQQRVSGAQLREAERGHLLPELVRDPAHALVRRVGGVSVHRCEERCHHLPHRTSFRSTATSATLRPWRPVGVGEVEVQGP